jgi:hypothetical protein
MRGNWKRSNFHACAWLTKIKEQVFMLNRKFRNLNFHIFGRTGKQIEKMLTGCPYNQNQQLTAHVETILCSRSCIAV